MSRIRISSLAAAFAVALSLVVPATARAENDPYRVHSSSVGLADGQYARLHAYFVAAADPVGLPPGPCRITLRFLGANGATLAESIVTLVPRRDTFLDYQPQGLRPGVRETVRAVIIAERDERGVAPRVIPSLEVVDVATSRTTVADLGSIRGFNPQPEPPGDFGTFGLASLQVGRVSASYVGFPSDSGLPPGPCNVALSIVSGNGSVLVTRTLTVSPGETVSIDFPAGYMVPGVRRRMWANVSTDGREMGFVTGSVEVFDEPTGQSTVLHPAAFVQSWGWE